MKNKIHPSNRQGSSPKVARNVRHLPLPRSTAPDPRIERVYVGGDLGADSSFRYIVKGG